MDGYPTSELLPAPPPPCPSAHKGTSKRLPRGPDLEPMAIQAEMLQLLSDLFSEAG